MTRLRSHLAGRMGLTAVCIAAALAVVVGFGVVSRLSGEPPADGPGREPLRIATTLIDWQDRYTVRRRFVGRVEAKRESDVGFEIAGRLASVGVEEGQFVPATTPLAQLDTARLDARKHELVATRNQAQANLDAAAIALQRLTEARDNGAANPQEWDDADAAQRAASAELSRANAAVATIVVDIDKAELQSPYDAIVAARLADEGRVLDAGAPVLRLMERANPEVRVGVGGPSIDAVSVGQTLDVETGRLVVPGTVTAILPTRDRAGRGVDVVLTLGTPLGEVRSGDLARITIEQTAEARGAWVPLNALTEGARGLWSVYVTDPGPEPQAGLRVLRRVEVEVIHQEQDRVLVRGPLAQDQPIVADGLHRVAPGMTVRVEPGLETATAPAP